MTQYIKPFEPVKGGTLKPSVSSTATAVSGSGGDLPDGCDTIVVSNTDNTAVVFVRVSPKVSPSVAEADKDMPVLPLQQVRFSCPKQAKFSIIADTGTPVVFVTPGNGN